MGVLFHADTVSRVLMKYRSALCNWLRRNGIDPYLVFEVTVRDDQIEITELVVDATGRYIFNDGNDGMVTDTKIYPLKDEVPTLIQAEYERQVRGEEGRSE